MKRKKKALYSVDIKKTDTEKIKKLSDVFEGGSIKQQKRKKASFFAIIATASLLAATLLATASYPAFSLASRGVKFLGSLINREEPKEELKFSIGEVKEGSPEECDLLLFSSSEAVGNDVTVNTITVATTRPKKNGSFIYYVFNMNTASGTRQAVNALNDMISDFTDQENAQKLYLADAYQKAGKGDTRPLYSLGTTFKLQYDSNKGSATEITGESIYGNPDYKWIYSNAHAYGFVSLENEGEPDLFRYIGVHHATAMSTHGLSSVSAYTDFLKSNTSTEAPLSLTTSNEKSFAIYYQSKDSAVMLPTQKSYQVSQTPDGYVISVEIQ